MKRLILCMALALSFNARAEFLPMASNQILSVIDFYTDSEDVVAWQVKWEGSHYGGDHRENIRVDVKSAHGHHHDIYSFGCHVHHDHLHCGEINDDDDHNHGHKHGNHTDRFAEMREVERVALARAERQFSRFGGWDAVSGYKLWVELDADHDHDHDHHHDKGHHGHGNEYWLSFDLEINGQKQVVYFNCHRHGHSSPFSCHLMREGRGEPSFGHGHGHAH